MSTIRKRKLLASVKRLDPFVDAEGVGGRLRNIK